MIRLTPEEIKRRFPVSGLRFYRSGLEVRRKSVSKKRPVGGKKRAVQTLSKSSLSRLAFTAQNTGVEFASMLTLTYGKIYPGDGVVVKKSLNRFLTFLRKRYAPLSYLWFLEFQKRGAPHVHLMIGIKVVRTDRLLVAGMWLQATMAFSVLDREIEPLDFADCCLKMWRVHKHEKSWENLRSRDGARGYITKYASKPHQKVVPKEFHNVGRFWGHSRDVKAKILFTQDAVEADVRQHLRNIGHKMAESEVLPRYLSTYATNSALTRPSE